MWQINLFLLFSVNPWRRWRISQSSLRTAFAFQLSTTPSITLFTPDTNTNPSYLITGEVLNICRLCFTEVTFWEQIRMFFCSYSPRKSITLLKAVYNSRSVAENTLHFFKKGNPTILKWSWVEKLWTIKALHSMIECLSPATLQATVLG